MPREIPLARVMADAQEAAGQGPTPDSPPQESNEPDINDIHVEEEPLAEQLERIVPGVQTRSQELRQTLEVHLVSAVDYLRHVDTQIAQEREYTQRLVSSAREETERAVEVLRASMESSIQALRAAGDSQVASISAMADERIQLLRDQRDDALNEKKAIEATIRGMRDVRS